MIEIVELATLFAHDVDSEHPYAQGRCNAGAGTSTNSYQPVPRCATH